MKKLLALLGLLMLAAIPSQAQVPNQGCTQVAIFNTSSAAISQLVALQAGNTVRICGFVLFGGGTTAVKFVYGTGSNCATGATDITPAFPLTAQTGVSYPAVQFSGLRTLPGTELCLNNGSAAQVTGFVTYSQGP